MAVRPHLSQHEAAERLPLVTDSATVTVVEAMDHNRNDEVERAVARRLREHGRDEWVREANNGLDVDWDAARVFADEAGLDDLATLVERFDRPYPSLLRLRIDPHCEFDFAAGQYVTIRYQHTPRPYSIASSPTEEEVELCIRRVRGGRLTTKLFEHAAVGDEVAIRGPNGEFVPKDPSGRDAVFLATGTGIAPLRSMIEYLYATDGHVHDGAERDFWVFLGCGWADDVPYRERFRELADAHEGFHFVPCLTREGLLTDWDGETDYVQRTFLKYLDPGATAALPADLREQSRRAPDTDVEARMDPSNLEVYACGTNAMVQPLVEVATRVGVPDRFVDAEGFG